MIKDEMIYRGNEEGDPAHHHKHGGRQINLKQKLDNKQLFSSVSTHQRLKMGQNWLN